MADAEAGSLNTCSLNTQSFVNVLHEKSELLEAQREVLMDRIDQVQADINVRALVCLFPAAW